MRTFISEDNRLPLTVSHWRVSAVNDLELADNVVHEVSG
jgi:hypothetical protein